MDAEVGFEDITLVVSSLFPFKHEVLEHKDTMNDTLAGYTHTAAFNMVLINENEEGTPIVLHLQVICNFRKVIGHYVAPFHKYLAPVAKHARAYLDKWHRSIQSVYAGKAQQVPSVYDRSMFFLDDSLDYTLVTISEAGKHKQTISAEYILTEVNVSRTLSLSMFIDPIVKLQKYLKFDQTIELALACSFLSNPFWFDWTMSTLIQQLDNPDNPFQFGLHPFYDWAHNTIEIFGSWQGGPYNRWSPCGGSKETVLETFGAHPNATKKEKEDGERKLCRVVSILMDHVEWINSLSSCGNMPVVDMPLVQMKAKCLQTVKEIAGVASCQFSQFRLGILTTILSGCGLLKAGKHLRHLMYPVKGSASFKHLCCPVADFMSQDRAQALVDNKWNESISNDGEGFVAEDFHDIFMQYLSSELGFPHYFRDQIECILCESHPMRSLNCCDWYRKGMSLYDCNEKGEFFRRTYGKETAWEKLQAPEQYVSAYIAKPSIVYIALDAMLTYNAADFGEELRSCDSKDVKFKGRGSRTSNLQRTFTNTSNTTETFCHSSMKMADFYVGSMAKKKKLRSLFVLGDAEHAVDRSACNNLEDYRNGKHLYRYLQTLLKAKSQATSNGQSTTTSMAAGCYHMDSETNNDQMTFFPGHLDKPFVHTAWFVPLGSTAFFTVISVSKRHNPIQDAESMRLFDEWRGTLATKDIRKLEQFLQDFDSQAKKHMRQDSLIRLIYVNRLGSVLSFPANQYYHATITPAKPNGFPRDMFIFHPLDGTV